MSRSIKASNRAVFEKLYAIVAEHRRFDAATEPARWIKGSKADSALLAYAEISSNAEWERRFPASVIIHEDRAYFVTVGFGPEADCGTVFTHTLLTPGVFALVVAETSVAPLDRAAYLKIENELMPFSAADKGYSGHDLNDLTPFFPQLTSYELSNNCPVTDYDLTRLLGLFLCSDSSLVHLPLPRESLDRVQRLLEDSDAMTPYEILVTLMTASRFEEAFLQAYRLVELLYQVIGVEPLYRRSKSELSFSRFLREVNDALLWRPVERQTLETLIARIPAGLVSMRSTGPLSFWHCPDGNVAPRIYKLRNSIVHRQLLHEQFRLDDSDWISAIDYLLDLALFWYPQYRYLLQ